MGLRIWLLNSVTGWPCASASAIQLCAVVHGVQPVDQRGAHDDAVGVLPDDGFGVGFGPAVGVDGGGDGRFVIRRGVTGKDAVGGEVNQASAYFLRRPDDAACAQPDDRGHVAAPVGTSQVNDDVGLEGGDKGVNGRFVPYVQRGTRRGKVGWFW
jgi:hypothetical protein